MIDVAETLSDPDLVYLFNRIGEMLEERRAVKIESAPPPPEA